MIYHKDFRHLSENYVSTKYPFHNRKRAIEDISRAKKDEKDSTHVIGSFLKMYLVRSSIHGVRYVVDDELKLFERLIWAVIVILSIFFTTGISILLANRFYGSPLQTVIESTMHPVKNIYFPAVTICNNNRVDWTKLEAAKKKFISNASKEVEDLFTRFVSRMEILDFANFDTFKSLRNDSLQPLDSINMAQLSDFVTHSCEDMFIRKCWWRFKEFPCCEIFVKQKTEYGFCYAFNSVVNEVGLRRWEANEPDWPLRTYNYGDWSGLRIYLVAKAKTKVPQSDNPLGVQVITHYPFAWPNNGILVPAGTHASVSLKPKLSYAMPSTRRYDPKSRECIFTKFANGLDYKKRTRHNPIQFKTTFREFSKKALALFFEFLKADKIGKVHSAIFSLRFQDEAKEANLMNLPGLEYMLANCLSGCRQYYTVLKCNCTVEAFFPLGNYRPCIASDFLCLVENNDVFNLEIVDTDFVQPNMSGMICPCYQECSALDYQTEIMPMDMAKENFSTQTILLDIHFQHGSLIKYRTDVVYSWLDLLVAFGGIAGLFMGASMLSGIELIYFFTIGIIVHFWDQFKGRRTAKVRRVQPLNSRVFTVTMSGKFSAHK